MPKPANTHFYGDVVTVTINAQGVTDVKDTNGNESLNQSGLNELELQVQPKEGGAAFQTIKIVVQS